MSQILNEALRKWFNFGAARPQAAPPENKPEKPAPAAQGVAQMSDLKTFWNWSGKYVGYRVTDALFSDNGRQVGYFAEGDEVYACGGDYMGEVKGGNRLITNLSKKAWKRGSLVPRLLQSSPGHRDVNSKDMLAGFEDFPVSQGA